MWKLKKNQPPFEAVDGEFAGRQFVHGKRYKEIPGNDKDLFEQLQPVVAKPAKQAKEVKAND